MKTKLTVFKMHSELCSLQIQPPLICSRYEERMRGGCNRRLRIVLVNADHYFPFIYFLFHFFNLFSFLFDIYLIIIIVLYFYFFNLKKNRFFLIFFFKFPFLFPIPRNHPIPHSPFPIPRFSNIRDGPCSQLVSQSVSQWSMFVSHTNQV